MRTLMFRIIASVFFLSATRARFRARAFQPNRIKVWAGLVALATACVFVSPSSQFAQDPQDQTAIVRARLMKVKTPEVEDLARVLEVEILSDEGESGLVPDSLISLGDLDGDGIPEYALSWSVGEAEDAQAPEPSEPLAGWSVFLLAWDGSAWQSSLLMSGYELVTVEVLPTTVSSGQLFAAIVYAGPAATPYPAVFRFGNHQASLAWNGRSDETLYQGHDHGRLDFDVADGKLRMIETGRADPGLLRFPKNGARGFEVRTVYHWNGKSFAPSKTDYSQNFDFVLYRFISALHLRDFTTAYLLIEPAAFLKTDKPSLEVFRKMVEAQWPEFLDDRIFRARDSSEADLAFVLRTNNKTYVYTPAFRGPSGLKLTGLDREERAPDSD
jgi:hypothetical protein